MFQVHFLVKPSTRSCGGLRSQGERTHRTPAVCCCRVVFTHPEQILELRSYKNSLELFSRASVKEASRDVCVCFNSASLKLLITGNNVLSLNFQLCIAEPWPVQTRILPFFFWAEFEIKKKNVETNTHKKKNQLIIFWPQLERHTHFIFLITCINKRRHNLFI